jgi:hypothetical protein
MQSILNLKVTNPQLPMLFIIGIVGFCFIMGKYRKGGDVKNKSTTE